MATAYTELNTIHNPTTGTSPPASWGDGVRDNCDALFNPPLAHVYNSAAQSIPYNSDTVVTFDSENEDTDTLHSTSTNTGRFTAAKAGWYHVTFYGSWAANSTGRRRLTLRKNGSAIMYVSQDGESSGTTNQNLSWLVDMAASDYVDVLAYQNETGTGALNLTAEFQIVRVSGT